MLTIFLAFAGVSAAQVTDSVSALGQAAGGAAGAYEVDATGAYDAAAGSASNSKNGALDAWDQANAAYEQARDHARATDADVAMPEMPDADLPTDALSRVEAAHADQVSKSLEAETGLVDVNADASAWGDVKAFFTGIADALGGAFDGIKDALDIGLPETDAADQATDAAFGAVDETRAMVDTLLRTDAQGADLEPRIAGEYAFEHAGELSSDATGIVAMP